MREMDRGRRYKATGIEPCFSKALRHAEAVTNSKQKREARFASIRGLGGGGAPVDDVSAPCSPTSQSAFSEKAALVAPANKELSRLEKLRIWREEKKAAEQERAKAARPVFKLGHATSAEPVPACLPTAVIAPGAIQSAHPGSHVAQPRPLRSTVNDAKSAVPATAAKKNLAQMDATKRSSGGANVKTKVACSSVLPSTASSRVPATRPTVNVRAADAKVSSLSVTTASSKSDCAMKPPATSRLPRASKTIKEAGCGDCTKAAVNSKLVAPTSKVNAATTKGNAVAPKANATSKVKAVASKASGASSKVEADSQVTGAEQSHVPASDQALGDVKLGCLPPMLDVPAPSAKVRASFAPPAFEFKAPEGITAYTFPSFAGPPLENSGGAANVNCGNHCQSADAAVAAATEISKHSKETCFESLSKSSTASRMIAATPAKEWRGRSALARLAKAATPGEKMDIISRSPLVEMHRRTPKSCTPPVRIAEGNATATEGVPLQSQAPLMFCLSDDEDLGQPSTVPHSLDICPIGGSVQDKMLIDSNEKEDQLSVPDTNDSMGVEYFKKMLASQTALLNEQSNCWNAVLTTSDERLTDEVQGQIRTTVGQAQLLIAERFDQFSGLITACEQGTGAKLTTTADLQGFWEMIDLQVQDVLKKFEILQKLQGRDYVPSDSPLATFKVQSSRVGKGKRKKPANGPGRPISDSEEGAQKVTGKSKFALFRAQMMKQQDQACRNNASEDLSAAGNQQSPMPAVVEPRKSVASSKEKIGLLSDVPEQSLTPCSQPCAKPLHSALRDISNEKDGTTTKKRKKAHFSEAALSPSDYAGVVNRCTPIIRACNTENDLTNVFSPVEAATPNMERRRSARLSSCSRLSISCDRNVKAMSGLKSSCNRTSAAAAGSQHTSKSAADSERKDDDQFAARFLVPTSASSSGASRRSARLLLTDSPMLLLQGLKIDEANLSSEVMPLASPLFGLTPPISAATPGPSDLMVFSPEVATAMEVNAYAKTLPQRRSIRHQARSRLSRASPLLHFS